MNNIEFIHNDEDGLGRRVYCFMLVDSKIVLVAYEEQEKKTKRHKFRTRKSYNRYRKNCNLLKSEIFPIPDNVLKSVAKSFASNIIIEGTDLSILDILSE